MSKKRLGISIYPEFSKDEDTLAYLDTAASYGFDVLFMALIAGKEDREQVIQRYKGITTNAKELGFEICVDANPMVFKRMGCNASIFAGPIDLSFFKELDVDVIRLDLGMTDMEEAFLSRNDGFGARELREVIAIATEHRVFFAEKWHEYFA